MVAVLTCIVLVGLVVLPFVAVWMSKATGSVVTLYPFVVSQLGHSQFAGVLCTVGVLREAESAIDAERTVVRAEREAFREFAATVQTLQVNRRHSTGATRIQHTKALSDTAQMRTVQDAYRTTVMAIPDYADQYGETLREHMATELGHDTAAAVVDGQQFTRPLKHAVVVQASIAAQQREAFLDMLDDEEASVRESAALLREAGSALERFDETELSQQSFAELASYEQELRQDIARCVRLLETRQCDIHRKNRAVSLTEQSLLQEYLYRDLDTTFPALAATLGQLRRLHRRKRTVIRTISDPKLYT